MKTDEQAIRDLVVTWLDATKRGDIATVLTLMADDVVEDRYHGARTLGFLKFADECGMHRTYLERGARRKEPHS